MASRDKNTAIDGLTRRVLSSDAFGAATDVRECPSTDLLAAYYERSLDGAETAQFERHFSTCARCRQQLAALVRADESAAAGGATHTRPSWLSWFTNQWWLVPVAGTIVLAVVIYVGILPRMHPLSVPPESTRAVVPETPNSSATASDQKSQNMDEALSSSAPAPTPEASYDAREAKRDQPRAVGAPKSAAANSITRPGANTARRQKENASGAAGGLGGGRTEVQTNAQSDSEAVSAQAVPAQTEANESRQSRAQSQSFQQAQQSEASRAAQPAAAPAPAPPTPPASGISADRVQETESALDKTDTKKAQEMPPAPAISGGTLRANARGVAGAPAHTTTAAKTPPAPAPEKKATTASAPTGGPKQKAEPERKDKNAAANGAYGNAITAELRDRNVLIASPDPQSQWRIAEAGFVEHTENGGTTWTGVEPVENAQFAAGSSPAARTCWLVGRNGMIAVTTDALHWKVVKPPIRADFTAITAKNGTEATVTAAGGMKFSTRDTGKTWQKIE